MKLQRIETKIYEIRGQKVMLDYDLAELYNVLTKVLNQAVKRNIKRFPKDFMFQLTSKEWKVIQVELTNTAVQRKTMRSQIVTAYQNKRNISSRPFAFTEQGLAMLSGVLNSAKAIEVNIAIMRAFVFIRQYSLSHKELTQKLNELETKYNKQFKDVYEALHYLLKKDTLEIAQKERKRIGFKNE